MMRITIVKEVAAAISERGYHAEAKEFAKSGYTKMGIVVRKNPNSQIAPIAYVSDNEIDAIDMGALSVEEVAEKILSNLEENGHFEKEIGVEWIHDYEKARKNLQMRIGGATYKDYLKDSVHRIILDDIYIYPVIIVDIDDSDSYGSVRITESLLKTWGLSEDEVMEQALANSQKDRIAAQDLANLANLFGSTTPLEELDLSEPKIIICALNYVGSNLGSSICLAFDNFAKLLEDSFGEECYIVPSSVKELLVIPMSFGLSLEYIKEMCNDVNRSCVQPNDFLSDNIFATKDGRIVIAS